MDDSWAHGPFDDNAGQEATSFSRQVSAHHALRCVFSALVALGLSRSRASSYLDDHYTSEDDRFSPTFGHTRLLQVQDVLAQALHGRSKSIRNRTSVNQRDDYGGERRSQIYSAKVHMEQSI